MKANPPGLLVLVDHDDPPALPDAIEQVLTDWPAADRPRTELASLSAVADHAAALERAAVVWVWLGEMEPGRAPAAPATPADPPCPGAASGGGGLHELLGQLQERHLPVLLSRPGETLPLGAAFGEGVSVCPPHALPESMSHALAVLWSQAPLLAGAHAEIRLLRAHQGGLADQMGKIDEELRLAANLQREFLPRQLPRVGGVGFQALWRPAGYVSGDIYDVFPLDEHHVGLFIADAVGHGVPAALMTMYIKRSLRPKLIDPAEPTGYRLATPAEALAELNRSMCEQNTDSVRFATACYAVLDCRTLEMCLARAGHPYPMLLRAGGGVDTLEPEGGLLGVFPEETFDQARLHLAPGDRLLLYSDGFEVAFPGAQNAGADAGGGSGRGRLANEQYTREFLDFRHGTPEEAISQLRAKLDTQAGSLNQRDDLTVICLAVDADRPAPPRAEANPASTSPAMVTA